MTRYELAVAGRQRVRRPDDRAGGPAAGAVEEARGGRRTSPRWFTGCRRMPRRGPAAPGVRPGGDHGDRAGAGQGHRAGRGRHGGDGRTVKRRRQRWEAPACRPGRPAGWPGGCGPPAGRTAGRGGDAQAIGEAADSSPDREIRDLAGR